MGEDKCLRCGKCCYWEGTPCKYLKFLKDGSTECEIYENRLGTLLYEDKVRWVKCGLREKNPFNYPGCPYNKEEWVMVEWK